MSGVLIASSETSEIARAANAISQSCSVLSNQVPPALNFHSRLRTVIDGVAMPKPGEQIGPYTLITKLGKGSFGVVWLAERRTTITTTKVALKLPSTDEIHLEAIKREADLWVQASGHPNVLPIIEADVYGEHLVIASEYAPDGPLESWLEQHGGKAPSVEAAVDMTCGILAGLEHLHEQSIIHRDLKPANILLQRGIPRLADFGISRVLKTTSHNSVVSGTPAYMAPEAFDGKRSQQSDLWAVGVILFQLLSGKLPFPQTDMPSLLAAVITRGQEPLPSSVPKDLTSVVERSLQKDSAARYQSASEMRRALRSSIKSLEAVDTIRIDTQKKISAKEWYSSYVSVARRRPILLLMSVLVIVGLISVAARLGMRSNSTSPTFSATPLATLVVSPSPNLQPSVMPVAQPTASTESSPSLQPSPTPSPTSRAVRQQAKDSRNRNVNQRLFNKIKRIFRKSHSILRTKQ